jgi:hypothetical protein
MGLAGVPALAQTQYILDNGSIDAGTRTVQADVPGTGGTRTYELSGSIGQPDAGCLLGELVSEPKGTPPRGAQIVGGFMGAFACESYGDLVFPFCTIDVGDILCSLDCFAGMPPCDALGDIAPCGGDGYCDVGDILAALDAFAGIYLCPHACAP